MREAWTSPVVLPNAMTKFVEIARVWNKEVFGNLFLRKKRVVVRLKCVQVALSTNPNNFLVEMERDLKLEFTEISKFEEEFWAMKSRITWLVDGDRNTSFYHTLALVHRRKKPNHLHER